MILEFDNLIKEYKNKRVLDIGYQKLDTTGRTAIIGANGAGKSTLVNIIAGIDKATSGGITYDGNIKVPHSDITLVFQSPYLIKGTVEMNIKYPMKLRNWDKECINNRTDELLTELGLEGFRNQKTWKLSGGEKQKVALARAISFYPKLLILDEPTASIDMASTDEIEKMLVNVSSKNNIDIIIITHNLPQAKRLSNNTIFMHEGQIAECNKTEKLLYEPENEFTKKFISGEILTK